MSRLAMLIAVFSCAFVWQDANAQPAERFAEWSPTRPLWLDLVVPKSDAGSAPALAAAHGARWRVTALGCSRSCRFRVDLREDDRLEWALSTAPRVPVRLGPRTIDFPLRIKTESRAYLTDAGEPVDGLGRAALALQGKDVPNAPRTLKLPAGLVYVYGGRRAGAPALPASVTKCPAGTAVLTTAKTSTVALTVADREGSCKSPRGATLVVIDGAVADTTSVGTPIFRISNRGARGVDVVFGADVSAAVRADARVTLNGAVAPAERCVGADCFFSFEGAARPRSVFPELFIDSFRHPDRFSPQVLAADGKPLDEKREYPPAKPVWQHVGPAAGVATAELPDAIGGEVVAECPQPICSLLKPGRVDCEGDLTACGTLVAPEFMGEPAMIRLSEQAVARLRAGETLAFQRPFHPGITVQGAPAGAVRVTVEAAKCRYRVRQLTYAYAGLAQAQVAFSVEVESGPRQCTQRDWLLTGNGVSGYVELGASRPDLIVVRFQKLPALTVGQNPPFRVPLTITRRYGGTAVEPSKVPHELHLYRGPTIEPIEHTVSFNGVDFTPLVGESVLPLGRMNRVQIAAPASEWRLLLDQGATTCDGRATRSPLKSDADGFFCFSPRIPRAAYRLQFLHRKALGSLLLPHRSIDAETAKWPLEAGYLLSTEPELAVARRSRGRNLQADMWLQCFDDDAAEREIRPRDGTRSVEWEALADCRLKIRLWEGEAADKAKKYREVLGQWGDQRMLVKVHAQIAADEGAKTALAGFKPAVLILPADRVPSTLDSHWTLSSDGVLTYESLALTQGLGAEVGDYKRVQVTIEHDLVGGAYVKDTSISAHDRVWTVTLRREPKWFAWRWSDSGVGGRLFVTGDVNIGSLYRFPPAADLVSESGDLDALQTVTVGTGMLAVLEIFDFDDAEPVWGGVAPQFHFGMLLSSEPADGAALAFSMVTGFGLRLFGNKVTSDSLALDFGFIAWWEWARCHDGGCDSGPGRLIFGLKTGFGSFPN